MLPLKNKFNLSSFTIVHNDGSHDTFDGSLADAYASLKEGERIAYSNLGKKYQGKPFMSWAPVIVDAENLHDVRPVIRKLSKEHGLAVGRLSSKQIVLIFPLDRNFPVQGSDIIHYHTVYQSLLSYFVGVVKTTAKDAGVKLTVHQAPYLKTPSSEMVHLVQDARHFAEGNATNQQAIFKALEKHDNKKASELKKNGFSNIITSPKSIQFNNMDMFLNHGDDKRTLYVSKAIHYSKLTESFVDGAYRRDREYRNLVNADTEKQLLSLVQAVYLHYHKDDEGTEDRLHEIGRETERLNPYSNDWDTHFEELTQEPSDVYGLKAEWGLKFNDGKEWIVPTETLMKMVREDISDIKTPRIKLITTGKGAKKHPKAGMTSNYELEIVDPTICGHALAYNSISKQAEFLHAIDTRYVHGHYEDTDDETISSNDNRSRSFHLTDDLITQIKAGLEQVEENAVNRNGLIEAITAVAKQNSYNPVSSYLDALPAWDGKGRLSTMFINFLGVPDTPIMRKESEIFGIAAVYLPLNAGAKFDQLFDFIGTQGVGKTTFLQKYFNSFGVRGVDPNWNRDNFDWYLQGIRTFNGKDDVLAMAGMLCVNDDEMVASKFAGVETLKQIASTPFFKVRVPYGIKPTRISRTFIMCRTSNVLQNQYKASHGQRKFVPFIVSKDRHTMDCAGPNSKMTTYFVDQCWAEAYVKYCHLKADGNLTSFFSISDAEEDQLKEARVRLQYIDDLKIDAIGFVNERLTRQGGKFPVSFKTSEIRKFITNDDRENVTLDRKLQPILTNDLGFKHTLVGSGRSRRSGYVSTEETKKDLEQLNNDLKKM